MTGCACLFNRPLEDADRPRLFATVVALIAGATLILALLDDPGPAPEPTDAPARPSTDAPVVVVPAASDDAATQATPNEESNPQATLQASRADIAYAKRAARRFLAAYLPYTYGHGQAERIPAATPELRAQLGRARPRVPENERRRRPRLQLLQTDTVTGENARLVAFVRDGARRYSVRLQLANTAAGWQVTQLEG